jgi:5,10-methylenetetrahydromethanopterin reductase
MTHHEISIAFQTDKSAAQYRALAQLVNQYDFDVVSVYCDLPYHPGFAAALLMASHLQRARIGVAANPPARVHPLDMAAQAALLNDVAPGGAYLGIARGAWLADHAIHEPQSPIQAIREAVDIVRYMLAGGTGGYHGQVYQLAEHVKAPYPLPEKPIPILIGTWGRKLSVIAGELADEVKVGGSANPEIVPVMQKYIAEGERLAERAVGTVRVVLGAVSVLDEDRHLARQMARRAVALYLPVVAPLDPTLQVEPEQMARIETHVNRGEPDAAAALISDELLEKFAIAGNVEDFINHASRMFAAGAGRIEFGTPHGIMSENGIKLLGERVIPALRHEWS